MATSLAEAREAGEIDPSALQAYYAWLNQYLENEYALAFGWNPSWKAGDVNQDGWVNVSDVSLLVDILLEKAEATSTSDVNGDNGVNITDVSRLVDIILGGK